MTGDSIHYRIPTVADAGAVAEVHMRSMRESYAGIIPDEVLAKLDVAEWTGQWRDIIISASHPIFVATVAERVVGFIRTEDCDEALEPRPDSKIRQLYVLKEFHRRGIGRRLVQLAADAWLACGARSMSVGVLTENVRSRAFYEGLGSRLALQGSFPWDGHEVSESIYVFDDLRKVAAAVTYRIPTLADAEAIARLHVAAWRETYAGIVPASVLDAVDLGDRIERWRGYLASAGVTFLAEADGGAAGFIRAGVPEEPLVEGADGHIFALYVLRRYHRQGIGRRLLGLTAAEWLRRGGRALSVGVLTENRPALAFYQGVGAHFARAETYCWDGHDLPESIYVFRNLQELAAAQ